MTDDVTPVSPSASDSSSSSYDTDRVIQVLTLEYQNLTSQITARLSARYQFLGFLTAGAAILAASSGHPFFSGGTYVLAILAAGVLVLGMAGFWGLGRVIAILSARVTETEGIINGLFPGPDGSGPILRSWETGRRKVKGFRQTV